MAASLNAPWTPAQVKQLERRQANSMFHPYTCPVDHKHGEGALQPTEDGWECKDCGYRQDWAHITDLGVEAII